MAKERSKYLWWLLIVSFLGVSSIAVLFFRMKNAENSIIEYIRAKTCPSIANCRKVIPAKILESKEFSMFIPSNSGKGNKRGTVSATYTFSILTSESKNETVTVVPNIPSNTNNFDIAGVYLPQSSYLSFVENNFFDQEPIEIEIWHNTITFLFVDSIQNQPNNLFEKLIATPTQKTDPIIIPGRSKIYQIAIPTTNNPVVIAEFARNDFWGWGTFVGFGAGCIVLALLSKVTRKKSKQQEDL